MASRSRHHKSLSMVSMVYRWISRLCVSVSEVVACPHDSASNHLGMPACDSARGPIRLATRPQIPKIAAVFPGSEPERRIHLLGCDELDDDHQRVRSSTEAVDADQQSAAEPLQRRRDL